MLQSTTGGERPMELETWLLQLCATVIYNTATVDGAVGGEALPNKAEEQACFGRKKQQDGTIKWMALGTIPRVIL